jgi:hypothetical protein
MPHSRPGPDARSDPETSVKILTKLIFSIWPQLIAASATNCPILAAGSARDRICARTNSLCGRIMSADVPDGGANRGRVRGDRARSRLRPGEEFSKPWRLREARLGLRPHLRAKLLPLTPILAHGPTSIARSLGDRSPRFPIRFVNRRCRAARAKAGSRVAAMPLRKFTF